MAAAAEGGHVEIVELCAEWGQRILTQLWFTLRYLATSKFWNSVKNGGGVTDFDAGAMAAAVEGGHVEIVKLCKEWGATNFNEAFESAKAEGDRVEIKKLCREWGGFGDIHREFFNIITSANFLGRFTMLPIAWHPEMFWDWCVDEEEKKRFLEEKKRFLEERLWL